MDTTETNQATEQAERTFTQAELDSIIKSRLADEKKKYADYDALKEKAGQAESLQSELNQLKTTNSINQMRSAVSKETGVPVELLVGDDEESCKAYAEKIIEFARPKRYPGTKTNHNSSTTSQSDAAMREFARQIFGKGD
ncbi:MAG: hypothetical protein LUG65_03990 [Clostridiales bacterium]|nr:hypothetical protein [Clostridiales bacterium]